MILTWMACANGVGEVRLVGPVGIHYEDILVPCWTIARRIEQNFRAVRGPGGSVRSAAAGRDLDLVGAVCVHNPDLAGFNKDDLRAVRRPRWEFVSVYVIREIRLVGSVCVHNVDLVVSVTV